MASMIPEVNTVLRLIHTRIFAIHRQKKSWILENTDPTGIYDLTNVTFTDNEIKRFK